MQERHSDPEKVNLRHLRGFRRFQQAALRALSAMAAALKDDGEAHAGRPREKPAVKVADMKSLVAAYKDAVAGERMVLGMEGGGTSGWPDEMAVRWVEDEEGQGEGEVDIP